MKLPPHDHRVCVGVDIYGVTEACLEPPEDGSPFPVCARHREMLAKMPRRRTCAGALVYDHAMRPQQTACNNVTGHEGVRLCASCRVVEAREKARADHAFRERCPTCQQPLVRKRTPAAVPPRGATEAPPRSPSPTRSRGGPASPPASRPSFQTNHPRPTSEPAPFVWRQPPKYEPEGE